MFAFTVLFYPAKVDFSNVAINGPPIQLDSAKAHDNTQDILINLLGTDLQKLTLNIPFSGLIFLILPPIKTSQIFIPSFLKSINVRA